MNEGIIKRISLVALLVILAYCQKAEAASIGVKPEKISISGAVGKILPQDILVFNAGVSPNIYSLSANDSRETINIEPKEFLLEAGAERLVTISAKSYFSQNIQSDIAIVAHPSDAGSLSASAGVKIPVKIRIYFTWIQVILISLCLVGVVMLLLEIIRRTRQGMKSNKKI